MSVFSKLAHFCEFCVYLSAPLRRAEIHSAYFKDCGSLLDLDTLPPARGGAQASTGKRGEIHIWQYVIMCVGFSYLLDKIVCCSLLRRGSISDMSDIHLGKYDR